MKKMDVNIEKTGGSSIPVLDFVFLADPCHVVMDELWDKFLSVMWDGMDGNEYYKNRHGRGSYVMKMTGEGGSEVFLLFGDTNYGDGSYDWLVKGTTIKINTSDSSGSIPVDAGLIGIISCNEEAVNAGLIDMRTPVSGKNIIKNPGEPFGHAKSISMASYDDGDFEFAVDTSPGFEREPESEWNKGCEVDE